MTDKHRLIDQAETLRQQVIILNEEINTTRLELERVIQHSTPLKRNLCDSGVVHTGIHQL